MALPVWFEGPSKNQGDGSRYDSPAAERLRLVRDGDDKATPRDPDQEQVLFSRLCDGDLGAFEQLYKTYYASLLRFARRFVPTREDAADVVQQVFANLWIHRANVTVTAPPAPYLFGAVRNRSLSHRARFEQPIEPSSGSDSVDGSARQTMQAIDLRASLDAAIAELPERQRAALLLWWVEELNYADVGRALGVSAVAARKLIVKALERLRPLLDPA